MPSRVGALIPLQLTGYFRWQHRMNPQYFPYEPPHLLGDSTMRPMETRCGALAALPRLAGASPLRCRVLQVRHSAALRARPTSVSRLSKLVSAGILPRWLALGLALAVFFLGLASAKAQTRIAWFESPDGGTQAFVQRVSAGPVLYRAYVIPGSGCRGMAPIVDAYFEGLRSAEVVVLHKRHVDPWRRPAPDDCGADFVAHDDLAVWAQEASRFLSWHLAAHPPPLGHPVLLVGISEGAELVPSLVRAAPGISQVALVGSTGLDPLEALQLQASRLGASAFVGHMLAQVQDARVSDQARLAGRTMAYWRALAAWQLAESLLEMPQPLWMGFGAQDANVPLAGFERFMALAARRNRVVCSVVFPEADHALQRSGGDDLQPFWALVESSLLSATGSASCRPARPLNLAGDAVVP